MVRIVVMICGVTLMAHSMHVTINSRADRSSAVAGTGRADGRPAGGTHRGLHLQRDGGRLASARRGRFIGVDLRRPEITVVIAGIVFCFVGVIRVTGQTGRIVKAG